jgi:hypothetical protein
MFTCAKILKQLFASGSVIIREYSPRLRLGEYSPIITSPSANNKQLLDEAEHDIKNYSDRGQCYLPKRS